MKRFRIIFSLLLLFGFSAVLAGKEDMNTYFPHAPGSYWIYGDQDGNELTRRVIENKDIDGETYHGFSYEPALADWVDYDYHIHPNFYQVGKDCIAFFVGSETERAIEAIIKKEMEADLAKQEGISTSPGVNIDISCTVEANAQDDFCLLPIPMVFDEEWIAMRVSGVVTLKLTMQSSAFQITDEGKTESIPFALVEKGKVVGTEAVTTPAGMFENCLKIEYLMDENGDGKAKKKKKETEPVSSDASGVEVTTLWLAPNVGIVKFFREFASLKMEKKLELTQYEIRPTDFERK